MKNKITSFYQNRQKIFYSISCLSSSFFFFFFKRILYDTAVLVRIICCHKIHQSTYGSFKGIDLKCKRLGVTILLLEKLV